MSTEARIEFVSCKVVMDTATVPLCFNIPLGTEEEIYGALTIVGDLLSHRGEAYAAIAEVWKSGRLDQDFEHTMWEGSKH